MSSAKKRVFVAPYQSSSSYTSVETGVKDRKRLADLQESALPGSLLIERDDDLDRSRVKHKKCRPSDSSSCTKRGDDTVRDPVPSKEQKDSVLTECAAMAECAVTGITADSLTQSDTEPQLITPDLPESARGVSPIPDTGTTAGAVILTRPSPLLLSRIRHSADDPCPSPLSTLTSPLNRKQTGKATVNTPVSYLSSPCTTPRPRARDGSRPSQRERILWLQRRRTCGTWVQCCDRECGKWRYLEEVRDPSTVPAVWKCSSSGLSCQLAQQHIANSCAERLVAVRFTVGSLVWARVDGHPWWPAIVDDDPDVEEFFWLTSFSDVPTHYHVTFLEGEDQPVTRAWVSSRQVYSFREHDDIRVAIHGRVRWSQYRQRLESALSCAGLALSQTLHERRSAWTFVARYRGPWPVFADSDAETALTNTTTTAKRSVKERRRRDRQRQKREKHRKLHKTGHKKQPHSPKHIKQEGCKIRKTKQLADISKQGCVTASSSDADSRDGSSVSITGSMLDEADLVHQQLTQSQSQSQSQHSVNRGAISPAASATERWLFSDCESQSSRRQQRSSPLCSERSPAPQSKHSRSPPPQSKQPRSSPPQSQHSRSSPPQSKHSRSHPSQSKHSRSHPPQSKPSRSSPSRCKQQRSSACRRSVCPQDRARPVRKQVFTGDEELRRIIDSVAAGLDSADVPTADLPSVTILADQPEFGGGKEVARDSTAGEISRSRTTDSASSLFRRDVASDPVKQTPATTDSVKQTPATTDRVEQTPVTTDPVKQTPATTDLVKQTPETTDLVKRTPATTDPVKQTPATTDPVKQTPATTDPVKQIPGDTDEGSVDSPVPASLAESFQDQNLAAAHVISESESVGETAHFEHDSLVGELNKELGSDGGGDGNQALHAALRGNDLVLPADGGGDLVLPADGGDLVLPADGGGDLVLPGGNRGGNLVLPGGNGGGNLVLPGGNGGGDLILPGGNDDVDTIVECSSCEGERNHCSSPLFSLHQTDTLSDEDSNPFDSDSD